MPCLPASYTPCHDCKSVLSPCAGAPRLFDLVDTKDELRPAFYNALGNTVVARNMDHAAEIAYTPKSQLRKVVTLKVRPANPLADEHLA